MYLAWIWHCVKCPVINFRKCSQYVLSLHKLPCLLCFAIVVAGTPWSPSLGKRRKSEAASNSASSSWETTWRPACLTSPWRRSHALLSPSWKTGWKVGSTTVAWATRPPPSCLALRCATRSPVNRPQSQNHSTSLKLRSGAHFSLAHTNSPQPIPCPTSSGHTSGPNWTPWTPSKKAVRNQAASVSFCSYPTF